MRFFPQTFTYYSNKIINDWKINMKIRQLIKQDNTIKFNGEVLDIYIPTKNFDRKLSVYDGEYIDTLGVFMFDIKTQKQADANEFGQFHTLKFPNDINFTYSSERKYKGTLYNGRVSMNEYNVFRLNKGDTFIANTVIEQSSNAVIKFVSALHSGQIPESIPYKELINLYLSVLSSNHIDLKNPSVVFELIISELCRNKTNLAEPFRISIANKDTYNEYGYKSINLKSLPALNSTFTALTFEDIDNAIVSSINRTNDGGKEKESPLEQIVKY